MWMLHQIWDEKARQKQHRISVWATRLWMGKNEAWIQVLLCRAQAKIATNHCTPKSQGCGWPAISFFRMATQTVMTLGEGKREAVLADAYWWWLVGMALLSRFKGERKEEKTRIGIRRSDRKGAGPSQMCPKLEALIRLPCSCTNQTYDLAC